MVEELSSLKSENSNLREKLAEQNRDIEDQKKSIEVKNKVAEKLNKELRETKKRAENEKSCLVKAHKSEVKAWRKDLGEETKQRIKLENKIEMQLNDKVDNTGPVASKPSFASIPVHKTKIASETVCSICGTEIVDYKPKYFLGTAFNPACADCDNSFESDNSRPDLYFQQSVLRPHFPPPTPSNSLKIDVNSSERDEPMFISSMVSHWNMNFIEILQRPASLSSMICHCAPLPPPGSSFITMAEVVEAFDKIFDKMKWSNTDMEKVWSNSSR